jgi:hypothetical protein
MPPRGVVTGTGCVTTTLSGGFTGVAAVPVAVVTVTVVVGAAGVVTGERVDVVEGDVAPLLHAAAAMLNTDTVAISAAVARKTAGRMVGSPRGEGIGGSMSTVRVARRAVGWVKVSARPELGQINASPRRAGLPLKSCRVSGS